MMRLLIADDEPLAREILRNMLAVHDDVELVGEAANGQEALMLSKELKPDVLLLDVQMPGISGQAVAEHLGENAPAIVFVTAYDKYALAAFDLHAVDYLLKPFDEERLAMALQRVRSRVTGERTGAAQALEEARSRGQPLEWLFLSMGERLIVRRASEVDWLEARRKVLHIHVGQQEFTMPGPLTRLESQLDPASFVRVSRSHIVNLGSIAEVQPWFAGEFVIVMKGGAKVHTTRGYRDKLENLMRRARRESA